MTSSVKPEGCLKGLYTNQTFYQGLEMVQRLFQALQLFGLISLQFLQSPLENLRQLYKYKVRPVFTQQVQLFHNKSSVLFSCCLDCVTSILLCVVV